MAGVPSVRNSNVSQAQAKPLADDQLKTISSKLAQDIKSGNQDAYRGDLLDAAGQFKQAGGKFGDFAGGIDAGLKANGVDGSSKDISAEQKQALQGIFQEAQDWSAKGGPQPLTQGSTGSSTGPSGHT